VILRAGIGQITAARQWNFQFTGHGICVNDITLASSTKQDSTRTVPNAPVISIKCKFFSVPKRRVSAGTKRPMQAPAFAEAPKPIFLEHFKRFSPRRHGEI
jgi:hypothetical protein